MDIHQIHIHLFELTHQSFGQLHKLIFDRKFRQLERIHQLMSGIYNKPEDASFS